jgi:hypothetical protein
MRAALLDGDLAGISLMAVNLPRDSGSVARRWMDPGIHRSMDAGRTVRSIPGHRREPDTVSAPNDTGGAGQGAGRWDNSKPEGTDMRIATMLGTAGVALLAGSATAQEISYDFDRSANFAAIKTYAWVTGHSVKDDLNHKRIVAAIDAQLAARGLSKVEQGASPDALVTYHVGFARDLQVTGYGSTWGGYRSRPISARTEQITVGTLAVDMMDAKTKSVIWRGAATRDMDVDASPEKREKNLNKAAEKMFEHYPTTGGK